MLGGWCVYRVRAIVGGLCLLLLLAGGHPGSLTVEPTSGVVLAADSNDNDFDEDDDSLDQFVDETIQAANLYWAGVFKQRGKAYHPPAVVKAYSDQHIHSKCGNSTGAEHS